MNQRRLTFNSLKIGFPLLGLHLFTFDLYGQQLLRDLIVLFFLADSIWELSDNTKIAVMHQYGKCSYYIQMYQNIGPVLVAIGDTYGSNRFGMVNPNMPY